MGADHEEPYGNEDHKVRERKRLEGKWVTRNTFKCILLCSYSVFIEVMEIQAIQTYNKKKYHTLDRLSLKQQKFISYIERLGIQYQGTGKLDLVGGLLPHGWIFFLFVVFCFSQWEFT